MKPYTVIFTALALDDVEQAVEYYNKQQSNLGKRFAEQVQVTLTSIKRNPFFASVRYDDIRCAQVKKFPFLVHYHIDDTKHLITIIAIYSTYQKPFW